MIPTWMAGGAIIGGVAAVWGYIKQFFTYITSFVVVRVKVEGELPTSIAIYCWHNLKRSPFGKRRYVSDTRFIRPIRRYADIAYEQIGKEPIVFWNRWIPLFLGERKESGPNSNSGLSITYIRGTWNIDQLLIDATELSNARLNKGIRINRFFITRYTGAGPLAARKGSSSNSSKEETLAYAKSSRQDSVTSGDVRILKWTVDDLGQEKQEECSALSLLAMPPEVDCLVQELRRWKESEAWYKANNIPWRRGWAIYGPPGSGKTSLVKAVAQDLDLPIFLIDIASMSNNELVSSWKAMMGSVPCIALIEDIDGIFNGRINHLGEMGGGLTFDCLLNVLGGIESANGVFLVITTNCIDKLDEALGRPRKDSDTNDNLISTRPGRIDRAFELKALTEDQRQRIAERILGECKEYIEKIVIAGDGDTGAQFQERCSQIALRNFWESKEPEKYFKPMRATNIVEKPFGDNKPTEPRSAGIEDIADKLAMVCESE